MIMRYFLFLFFALSLCSMNLQAQTPEQLAKDWGGQAITFQQLTEAMIDADIIIASTGAPHTGSVQLNRHGDSPAD